MKTQTFTKDPNIFLLLQLKHISVGFLQLQNSNTQHNMVINGVQAFGGVINEPPLHTLHEMNAWPQV